VCVCVCVCVYVYSTNIPPIMFINRIYETQNFVAVACFLPDRAEDLSAPLYLNKIIFTVSFGLCDAVRLGSGVMTSFSRRASLTVFSVSFLILFQSKHTYST
jgi:hypothetical protein